MAKNQEDFDVRISVLEHTVVAQNATTEATLKRIEDVLKEIHNKQDASILSTGVNLATLRGEIALVDQKGQQTNSKVNKFFGGLLTLIAAIIGGLFSMPEIFGLKK